MRRGAAVTPRLLHPDTHDDLRERFSSCIVYVADDDGAIVGCVLLQPQYASAEIYYAGVIPERRREGIGRQMIGTLLDGGGSAASPPAPPVRRTTRAGGATAPMTATRSVAGGLPYDCCISPSAFTIHGVPN